MIQGLGIRFVRSRVPHLLLSALARSAGQALPNSSFCRPAPSNHEGAMLLRRAGGHVAAPVQVIVDLGGGADHAAVEEDVEGRGLQILLSERARLKVLPKDREQ